MAYSEREAKALIIKAGHRLVKEGLVARTWGNISARISDTQFVITPSGLGYDTMQPEDLVTVNVEDCSWEGDRKPSSEKGIHADVYRLRPEVCFVIHTHQEKASVFGIAGEDLQTEGKASLLGSVVPCADYGLSSTKKLRRAVAAQVAAAQVARAVLMRNHGALCMGEDCGQAFLAAKELEQLCGKEMRNRFREWEAAGDETKDRQKACPGEVLKLGKSMRKGNYFCHLLNGKRKIYDLRALPAGISPAAALHASIYKSSAARYIAQESSPVVMEVCCQEERLMPYLDDLAQIAGTSIRFSNLREAAKALKGRNAVFIQGGGALCTGQRADDVAAVKTILRKGCAAQLFAKVQNDLWKAAGDEKYCCPLDGRDAALQRMVYKKKYSRKMRT
ncbi:MAG: class II aldolase/adducin family protein [Lachnospiraceae bacterium]|nr:class II aldolase/adducin family protein [Lachnospiraceae bacterium]